MKSFKGSVLYKEIRKSISDEVIFQKRTKRNKETWGEDIMNRQTGKWKGPEAKGHLSIVTVNRAGRNGER